MRVRHPSKKALRRWLDADELTSIDEHVSTCDRCASRLEILAPPTDDIAEALNRALDAPEDLVTRIGTRMTESMRNREDLQILLELLGIPWRTVQNLLTEGEDD